VVHFLHFFCRKDPEKGDDDVGSWRAFELTPPFVIVHRQLAVVLTIAKERPIKILYYRRERARTTSNSHKDIGVIPSESLNSASGTKIGKDKMLHSFKIMFLILLYCLDDAMCLAVAAAANPSNSQDLRVISTNKNGGHSKVFSFDTSAGRGDLPIDFDKQRSKRGPANALRKVQTALRSTFLPSGYPNRTPDGYLRYSAWSWVQDISTQLRSVLATQRVLEGVGVGREGATALSALMNFLVRDGCGMAAALIFTSAASSKFRTDVKRWRLFADIMVDLGITLEVAAIMVPRSIFLPMISVGNMCKAFCGVAAGACGGSINLHWAQGSDISDINAKYGAQHTVTGALGLVFAALFAKSVSSVDPLQLWLLYSALTILHIFANMRCMRLIAFDSFNDIRMNMVLAEFLTWYNNINNINNTTTTATPLLVQQVDLKTTSTPPTLSSPSEISKLEPLLFGVQPKYGRALPQQVPIYFGDTFNDFSERSNKSSRELEKLMMHQTANNKDDKYLISSALTPKCLPCVVVVLLSRVTPLQETKAYFHAMLLARGLEKRERSSSLIQENGEKLSDTANRTIVEGETQSELEAAWEMFQERCRAAGWDLNKTELKTLGYEVEMEA
jgi:hypothetical protein